MTDIEPPKNPATSINKEHLAQLLDNAESQAVTFWDKEVVISYKLVDRGNFTICGRAAVVDPANFVYETGLQIAREDALNQLWKLEGYLLQLKLSGLIETDIL